MRKGEYFVEFDKETESWCVFHTDIKTGFAYASCSSVSQAQQIADEKNEIQDTLK